METNLGIAFPDLDYQILIFFETSNLSQSPAELSASFLGGGWDLEMLPVFLSLR